MENVLLYIETINSMPKNLLLFIKMRLIISIMKSTINPMNIGRKTDLKT